MNSPLLPNSACAGDRARMNFSSAKNSSGMVLIVVLILAVLAGILAGGLYFASSSEVKKADQAIRFEKAFFLAETGVEQAKSVLRASADGMSDELVGADGQTNTSDDGVLGFGASVAYGIGTFSVRVTDNDDGDSNAFADNDDTVIVWSTGLVHSVQRVLCVEVTVPTILPPEFNIDGALSIYGTNTEVDIGGNAQANGGDYDLPDDFECAGTGCTGDLIPTNDAVAGVYSATTSTVTTVGGSAAITGSPPIQVGGGNYTEQYWEELAATLTPLATIVHNGGVIGGNVIMGTREAPQVALITGDTIISGNVDGAGILIITAGVEIDFTGTFHYEGIVILIGDGVSDAGREFNDKGNAAIFGSVVCIGNELDVKPQGSPQIMFSSEAIANLDNLQLPPQKLTVVSWREIKPI